jgi:hypothetical protein
MQEPEEHQEGQHQLTLDVFVQRLYRDPRYMLIGKTERFGRELISFVEGCTVLSATGEVRGQLLLNSEFELRGRPDGERPYDKDSLLDLYQESREKQLSLSEDDFSALRDESWLYYIRRNFGFLLGDYLLARDDAEHNLGIWHIVERTDADEPTRWSYLKWWPWIERDRAIAQALWYVEQGETQQAATELYRAEHAIEQFGQRYAEQYAQEEGEGSALPAHMAGHVRALVEILRRHHDLPLSLEEQLDLAEARGDTEEVERLRAEMIRRAMGEGEAE